MLHEPYNCGFSSCHSVQFSKSTSLSCSPDDFILTKGVVSFNSLCCIPKKNLTKGWAIVSFVFVLEEIHTA